MLPTSQRRRIVVLGGSFDPVHAGHVALARHCLERLKGELLWLIPAGNPWQKAGLHAAPAHRVAMLERAFAGLGIPIKIDLREIKAHTSNYTVETLQSLRAEVGPNDALVFLIGADQLQHLDTWHQWRKLFDHAHLCAATRPGFALDATSIPSEVAHEFQARSATPDTIWQSPCGRSVILDGLHVDISATQLRAWLGDDRASNHAPSPDHRGHELLPEGVFDYIQTHQLYRD